jgi:hypothetical protein
MDNTVNTEKPDRPPENPRKFWDFSRKLISCITVGYLAKIGGNAVVTKNISERATAVVIPARIVGINND